MLVTADYSSTDCPFPQVRRPALTVRINVPESLTHTSVQWLPRAPPLLPPSPPLCLRVSIMKPNTSCLTTWACCLCAAGRRLQLKVRKNDFQISVFFFPPSSSSCQVRKHSSAFIHNPHSTRHTNRAVRTCL